LMATGALVPISSTHPGGTIDFSFDTISTQIVQKVESCVYDMRTQRLGVLRASKDAYAVYVPGDKDDENAHKKPKKAHLEVCPVTAFGLPIPAYAIRTSIKQLEEGDLVNVGSNGAENWMFFLKEDEE